MSDFVAGGVWALACVCLGFIIGMCLVLVLADREPPDWGPQHEDPPIDPTPEELESWLEEHSIHPWPEVNLKP